MTPDRVTVLTCIGCGGMGRQEQCDVCTEHKLPLVAAAEFDALAEVVCERIALVERFAESDEPFDMLRAQARDAVVADALPEPDVVVGWWCDRCGNVDLPQLCIGVCVWQPAEWVNLRLYEPVLHAERALTRFLRLAAAVTPRPGLEERNREALRAQARSLVSMTRQASATSASRMKPSA
ncbi:hypothetical protein [Solirubrobacter soli]|uniref:hypothetical protein n=1 Tax=Solirubrobacter soli TaxID=363832 RepID=UPI00146B13A0|nr:hypothetical protein [Solirubrobacter soli]